MAYDIPNLVQAIRSFGDNMWKERDARLLHVQMESNWNFKQVSAAQGGTSMAYFCF